MSRNELISDEDLVQFEELAKAYKTKSLGPLFDNDLPDGDLSMLNEVIDTAFTIGLCAAPDPSQPGYEYGIWGKTINGTGLLSSVLLLLKIAEECGGIAALFHWQGLASQCIIHGKEGLGNETKRIGLGIQNKSGLPSFKQIIGLGEAIDPDSCKYRREDSGYVLNGTVYFVYCMDPVDHYLVFADCDNSFAWFTVPVDTKGVSTQTVGYRTGLRGCTLNNVSFYNVRIDKDYRVDNDNAFDLLQRTLTIAWTGLSAIAAGIARGAVNQAFQYASERYQGGTVIENHPIIQGLLSQSYAKAETAKSMVMSLTNIDLNKTESMMKAASAKLVCLNLCFSAVTDSLQVLGGYGYMEDFGMEKRLRDITVLKSSFGSPGYLKKFIFNCHKEYIL